VKPPPTYRIVPGHVRVNEPNSTEATTWPWPFTGEHQDAAWRARYAPGTLTKDDAMALAGIADAYSTLITHPARSLREKVHVLHRIYECEATKSEGE
jgi:hypothetical protein